MRLLFVRPTLRDFAGVAELRHARGSTGWPTARPGWCGGSPRWTTGSTGSFVDGLVNLTARGTYAVGRVAAALQTGNLRQYVMFIVVGTVALFVLISLYWSYALDSGP